MLFCSLPSQPEFPSGGLFRTFIGFVDVESIFAIVCIIRPVRGRPGRVFCQLSLQDPVLTFWVESIFFLYKQPELSILKDGILKNRRRGDSETIVLMRVSPSQADSTGSLAPWASSLLSSMQLPLMLSCPVSPPPYPPPPPPRSWDVSRHRHLLTTRGLSFLQTSWWNPGWVFTYSSFPRGLKLTITHHISRK